MTTGMVDIEVRYERLAQGIRGALILKSGDGDPHQLGFDRVELTPEVTGGPTYPVTVGDLLLEVQPGLDLVVPFEVRRGEVPRGVYLLLVSATVDGVHVADAARAEIRVR